MEKRRLLFPELSKAAICQVALDLSKQFEREKDTRSAAEIGAVIEGAWVALSSLFGESNVCPPDDFEDMIESF